MEFWKSGANFEDRNAIRRHAEQGRSAEEIAGLLKIQQGVVSEFMPKPKPRKRPRLVEESE